MVTQVNFLTSNPGYDSASRYVPNGKGARVSNTTPTHAVKFGRVHKASKLSDMFQATHAPGAKLGIFFHFGVWVSISNYKGGFTGGNGRRYELHVCVGWRRVVPAASVSMSIGTAMLYPLLVDR